MSASTLSPVAPRAAIRPAQALAALAVGFVVAIALIPVEIDRAFGLPAHPLLLHGPVVLIPVLVLATVAVLVRPAWRERYGMAWGALAVVTLISTVLAVGAGEKFIADRRFVSATLHDHKEAAETLRLLMFGFVAAILLVLARDVFAPSRRAIGAALAVVTLVLAGFSGFFVVRTGHLGAKSTWGHEDGGQGGGGFPGGRPPSFGGGQGGP